MNSSSYTPWIAVLVRPRAELVAEKGLASAGLETFVAWHGVRRRWSDRVKVVQENLFPGYVFCRSTFDDRFTVMRQPGVSSVVSFCRTPAFIPDEQIGAVRRMIASGLPLGPWPFLATGQRVRVGRGVLAGLEGTLVGDTSSWRVVVSIEALQRSLAVQIERDKIYPLKQSAA
ncbi:MAG TPA: transcription termination/antitermination NusG family protein [Bryobacteraceae bacterium]